MENQSVEHPDYYTSDPSGVECIDIVQHRDFLIGNVFKYIWRAGLKWEKGKSNLDKEIEDLEKARFYLNKKLELLYKMREG